MLGAGGIGPAVTKENALKRFALGLVASLVLAGGCAPTVEQPEKVIEVPAQSFTKKWSMDLGDAKHPKNVVEWAKNVGDYLVIFKSDRNAYIVDKRTGSLAAIDVIEGRGPVLPPFSNGKLMGFPVSTSIEVFDMLGKNVRTIHLDVSVESTATFSPTTIYIGVAGEHGGRILALDPKRTYDTPTWELLAFGAIQSAPVYYGGTLFFATRDGHVYAVSEKRQPVWPLDKGYFVAGQVTADIAVDDSGVYVASEDTKLISLNRATGKVQWEYFSGYPLPNAPVVTDETVYLSIRNVGLVAVDKLKGEYHRKALWTNHEAVKFLSEDLKYTYVQLRNNAIGALDRKTGAIAFRSPPSNIDFFVTNVAKDGVIYGVTKAGYVTAITPVIAPGTMGTQLFTVPTK